MYRLFDLIIESDIPLPELPKLDHGTPSIKFKLKDSYPKISPDIWFHSWFYPDGEIFITVGKKENTYFLKFPNLALFQFNIDNCTVINCYTDKKVSYSTLRHLLIDQVIPRIISSNGSIILHASSVRIENSTIAFLGKTGSGKSTLAASFHVNGYPLLSDDCLLLKKIKNKVISFPNYQGSRLWEDTVHIIFNKDVILHEIAEYTSKKRIIYNSQPGIDKSYPLNSVFILELADNPEKIKDIEVKKISGTSIIHELLGNTFVLDNIDKNFIRSRFLNISELAASDVSFYKLKFPHNHLFLDSVRDEVVNTLNNISKQLQ